jgi:hypothetical protein
MKYNNKEKKMKGGKNQPLPKGDKYHIYPKGMTGKREGYPDTSPEILKCQNQNVKATNADSYGMRN